MTGLEIAGTGLLLGLANGPACLVSCAPAVLPVVLTGSIRATQRRFAWPTLSRLLGGRLLAYGLVGGVAGLTGSPLQAISTTFSPWVPLVLAVVLLAHGFVLFRRVPCCLAQRFGNWAGSAFLMGLLTGFSLCPPFLLALAWIWGQGMGPLPAILFFLAFFGGTSVYLLPLGFGGYLENRTLVRSGRILSVGGGLFFLLRFLVEGHV
ncbi:MAG: sulfite exporter TauE/SafE family protein [Desulfobulbus sp.]